MEIYAHPRGYEVEVASLGGLPSALHAEDYSFGTGYALLRRTRDDDATWDPKIAVIGGVIRRYLQRGSAAPPTLGLEEAACRAAGLEQKLERAGKDSEEVGYQKWEGENVSPERLRRAVAIGNVGDGTPPELEPSLRETLLGSEEERRFLEWACTGARAGCGGRLLPQVLFRDLGTGSKDMRRADFVYSDGAGRPIVIEIDGIQHEESREADESRDEALEGLNLEVRRIPASVLKKGTAMEDAPGLRALEDAWKEGAGEQWDDEEKWAKATRWIQDGAALQAALTSLWMHGVITGAEDEVSVSGRLPAEVWRAAVEDWAALVEAIIDAHGLRNVVQRPRPKVARAEEAEGEDPSGRQVLIAVETEQPWWHRIPVARPDMVIRRCAPVATAWMSVSTDPEWSRWKKEAEGASEEIRDEGLGWLLQAVFRKQRFREAQAAAIRRWLDGKDTIVLLPTGAGKSMIYQLAGLISPGATLVVAPIVALIHDQREGLEQSGIRRMKALSADGRREDEADAIGELRNGTLIFLIMAPERLQKPEWRQALGVAREAGGIAGAVIDEGHCISEWGHDFRPAYGQLGSFLKGRLGVEAVLALTGTASRAVYRDMVAHLEVDREDPEACIRPNTHDRAEIRMSLKYCTSRRDAEIAKTVALEEVLRRLPPGSPKTVFRPRGKRSRCGIIFMPTVGGRNNGIVAGVDFAERTGLSHVVTYAGGEYQPSRIANARKFKRNRATVMVATGGYGMGVDKPNVRWVVHPHLTGSLESYYQQIGRAGRDRKEAYASAVLLDEHPEQTAEVLDARASFEEAREAYDQGPRRWDDVGTALYFHFGQFKGPEAELWSLLDTVERLGGRDGLDTPGERQLPYQKTLERDVVRLMRLGIVGYYEVHYGSRQVSVHVPKWSAEDVLQKLTRYVERFDRARAAAIGKELREKIERRKGSVKETVEAGCRALVEYLYETVEPARRRALHETVLMARTCKTEDEIRERMLDYLSEGKGSEKVDGLLGEARFDWKEWHELFGDIDGEGQMEAGRVRGLFIRALESNPGHPALLMGRAIAESACKDAAVEVVIENIRAAVEALPRYEREERMETAMNGVCNWIEQAEEDGLGPLCALAWLSAREAMSEVQGSRIMARAEQWGERAYMTEMIQVERSAKIIGKVEKIIGKVGEAEEMIRSLMKQRKTGQTHRRKHDGSTHPEDRGDGRRHAGPRADRP